MTYGDTIRSDEELRVLYYDDNLLIVDKPVNTVVHGKCDNMISLLEMARNYLDSGTRIKTPFLAPSNRLDRNTSGPVVFALNRETAILMRTFFSQCKVNKLYHARLTGDLTEPLFIQADIIKGNHRRASVENLTIIRHDFPEKHTWFSERTHNSGTLSATMIQPLETDSENTLVAVSPWTGRFHQIRAVCEAIGYPVCGDKKYDRTTGTRSVRDKRRNWTIPALICKRLNIEPLNIVVESSFSLL